MAIEHISVYPRPPRDARSTEEIKEYLQKLYSSLIRNDSVMRESTRKDDKTDRPWVCPEDYGAKGDGTANDYTALQDALNSGLPVMLGSKTYSFGSTLTLPAENGFLFGLGKDSILRYTGAGIAMKRDSNATAPIETNLSLQSFQLLSSGGTVGLYLEATYQVNIFDVYFSGSDPAGTGFSTAHIQIDSSGTQNAACINIRDCVMRWGGGHGVYFSCSDAMGPAAICIEGCRIQQNVGWGVYSPDPVGAEIDIISNDIEGNYAGLIQIHYPVGSVIVGNHLEHSGQTTSAPVSLGDGAYPVWGTTFQANNVGAGGAPYCIDLPNNAAARGFIYFGNYLAGYATAPDHYLASSMESSIIGPNISDANPNDGPTFSHLHTKDFIESGGDIYCEGIFRQYSNVALLNKAETAYITISSRNTSGAEAMVDLSSVKTINSYDAPDQVLTTTSGPTFDHLHITNGATFGDQPRGATSLYCRYYHIPLGSSNPGASGATWVDAGANTTGGWQLNSAGEKIRGGSDVHPDWDGASDLKVEVRFMINAAGADAGDTVDLKLVCYYKGVGDTTTKTQTVEVPTTVGTAAQYTAFKADFTIDWDAASNVVEAGDHISFYLNLETDTSEVDDVTITGMSYSYLTTHIGIEDGDE